MRLLVAIFDLIVFIVAGGSDFIVVFFSESILWVRGALLLIYDGLAPFLVALVPVVLSYRMWRRLQHQLKAVREQRRASSNNLAAPTKI